MRKRQLVAVIATSVVLGVASTTPAWATGDGTGRGHEGRSERAGGPQRGPSHDGREPDPSSDRGDRPGRGGGKAHAEGAPQSRPAPKQEARPEPSSQHAQPNRGAQSQPQSQPRRGSAEGRADRAEPAPHSSAGQDCNGTHHSDTGHGANQGGPYDNTCDGSAARNGNGGGQATGRPCAGCVGNADDKNPPGQYPDGSDHNAGYECDRNRGIGRTNPAHTGCQGGSEGGLDGTEARTSRPGGDTSVQRCRDGRKVSDLDRDGDVDKRDCTAPTPAGTVAICPGGVMVADRNGDGVVNGADCTGVPARRATPTVVKVLCPSGAMTTDVTGDGVLDRGDCALWFPSVPAVPTGVVLCPDGVMVRDLNGDGQFDMADCARVIGDGAVGPAVPGVLCPGGVMVRDVNGDGVFDGSDCAGLAPATPSVATPVVLCPGGVMVRDVNGDGQFGMADCVGVVRDDAAGPAVPGVLCPGGLMVRDANDDGVLDGGDCLDDAAADVLSRGGAAARTGGARPAASLVSPAVAVSPASGAEPVLASPANLANRGVVATVTPDGALAPIAPSGDDGGALAAGGAATGAPASTGGAEGDAGDRGRVLARTGAHLAELTVLALALLALGWSIKRRAASR